MNLKDYLASLRPRTAKEYSYTANYLKEWQHQKKHFHEFVDFLKSQNIAQNTVAKHVRQARHLCKQCNLKYDIEPVNAEKRQPHRFSDHDFQALYNAFNDVEFPHFILPEYRPLYWQTLIHFASVAGCGLSGSPKKN